MKAIQSLSISSIIICLNICILIAQTSPSRLSQKTAPTLHLQQKNTQSLRIRVNQVAAFLEWQQTNALPIDMLGFSKDSSLILIHLPDIELLPKLISCPLIDFIDQGQRTPLEESENDLGGFRINAVSAVHSLFPDLHGAGLHVSIKERAFDPQDIDFKGRVKDLANFPSQITDHATTMASLIGGGGNSSPLGKGVAWQVHLSSSSFENLLPDDAALLNTQGISVQNHSYGVGIENYYGLETQAYDKQVRENPHLLHVFSSGNSGDKSSESGTYAGITGFANLTAQFKMSKNTLSIGEIDAQKLISPLSSRGPAYDGRIKPELTAYGGFGSSESAALVSGISLLVQQAYRDIYQTLPSSALVRAALINSADDLGRPEVDFEYGFGSVDALGAVRSMVEERFIQDQISEGELKSYSIQVPPGTQKLKITLVWNDPEATPNAPKALINDLDLQLTDLQSGSEWFPWVLNAFPHADSLRKLAQRKADHLNNIEQITLDQPESGNYQISVRGYDLSDSIQDFYIVYEFDNQPFWIYPAAYDLIQGGESYTLTWNPAAFSGLAKLEYQYTGEQIWHSIAEIADPSLGEFTWDFPDTLALLQFRLTGNDWVFYSDVVTVSQAIVPQVGFDCEDEVLLFWSGIPGIEQYEVYNLGEKYLEPYAVVSDTLIIIPKNQSSGLYYALAPVLKGKNPKGLTINYTFQATECYFRSVLVREFISRDTIVLDVYLGTSYGLSAVTLQRFENGEFRDIVQINAPQSPNFTLVDRQPQLNRNLYRIALSDLRGRQWYSNEVDAFFVPDDGFFVYPNPVLRDELLSVLDASEAITELLIFQSNGKLEKTYTFQSGVSKEIPTEGLVPGLYFLHLKTQKGQLYVKKILIQ